MSWVGPDWLWLGPTPVHSQRLPFTTAATATDPDTPAFEDWRGRCLGTRISQ
jgi:hypothetical protein